MNHDFWEKMVVESRLSSTKSKSISEYRSVFDMDHDRIVFSNSFRRMHDKTQVFPYAPLSSSGQARSRLSHSLEVSCAARSLGILLGQHLVKEGAKINPYDLGMILASACLAHDIGNPPFGHSGEFAIQEWSKDNLESILTDPWEQLDFYKFEGNAQGFRILTRLESWQRKGGIRPTVSTLCAFTKYPCPSVYAGKAENGPSGKKHGYFKADFESFQEVFAQSSLLPKDNDSRTYPRHPLAYLTEAADDLCYAVVDLEDAYHLGIISFHEAYELLAPIASRDENFDDNHKYDNDLRIARLRSATISELINQAIAAFIQHIDEFENCSYNRAIIDDIESSEEYSAIYSFSMQRIYSSDRVLEIEFGGYNMIRGLLDLFVPAVTSVRPSTQEVVSRRMIPIRYFKRHYNYKDDNDCLNLIEDLSLYERILSVTDFISGMTDRYAVELYQRLSGIKNPVY